MFIEDKKKSVKFINFNEYRVIEKEVKKTTKVSKVLNNNINIKSPSSVLFSLESISQRKSVEILISLIKNQQYKTCIKFLNYILFILVERNFDYEFPGIVDVIFILMKEYPEEVFLLLKKSVNGKNLLDNVSFCNNTIIKVGLKDFKKTSQKIVRLLKYNVKI